MALHTGYKQEKVSVKAVFYTGTDALLAGYALCYDRDDTTALDETDTAIPATASSWGRHARVEKPATGNLHNFAGFVKCGSELPSITTAPVGGRRIDIEVPNGGVLDPFTEEDCTAMVTHLCLKPASYILGGIGEGLPVGIAIQTADRSSDNETIQAICQMPDLLQLGYGLVTPSSTVRTSSATIWETCPWNIPGLVHTYFNDYTKNIQTTATGGYSGGASTTEIRDWIQTVVTSGSTTHVDTVPGGILRVSSAAYNADDDGVTLMYRDTGWTPTDGKRIWFEARIRMSDIVTEPDQFFVGLINTCTDIHPSGVVDSTLDKIGFFTDSGSTAATLEFITSVTGTDEITTGAATGLVDTTWLNVGFVADLTTVSPYVNGTVGTAHATSVPTAATGLGICYGSHVEQTTAVSLLDVDWVKIAQLV